MPFLGVSSLIPPFFMVYSTSHLPITKTQNPALIGERRGLEHDLKHLGFSCSREDRVSFTIRVAVGKN
jgi:hypothetical protein